jgi:hypothetical protein
MSYGNNPYSSPQFGAAPSGGQDQTALAKAKPPALVLLIVTSLMMLLVLVGLVLNLLGVGLMAAQQGNVGQEDAVIAMIQGTIGLISGVVGLIVGGVVIYGCMQMMKLKSHGLAMTAMILSMLPCISPCCITGIPIGIWGLIVLNDPIVKSAFDRNS